MRANITNSKISLETEFAWTVCEGVFRSQPVRQFVVEPDSRDHHFFDCKHEFNTHVGMPSPISVISVDFHSRVFGEVLL